MERYLPHMQTTSVSSVVSANTLDDQCAKHDGAALAKQNLRRRTPLDRTEFSGCAGWGAVRYCRRRSSCPATAEHVRLPE